MCHVFPYTIKTAVTQRNENGRNVKVLEKTQCSKSFRSDKVRIGSPDMFSESKEGSNEKSFAKPSKTLGANSIRHNPYMARNPPKIFR